MLQDQQLLLLIHCLQHQLLPIMVLYVLAKLLTFLHQLLQVQLIAGQVLVDLLRPFRTPSITNVTLADAGTYSVTITVGRMYKCSRIDNCCC